MTHTCFLWQTSFIPIATTSKQKILLFALSIILQNSLKINNLNRFLSLTDDSQTQKDVTAWPYSSLSLQHCTATENHQHVIRNLKLWKAMVNVKKQIN